MQRDSNLPVVVIIGRPNVGKSTLFNAIIGRHLFPHALAPVVFDILEKWRDP